MTNKQGPNLSPKANSKLSTRQIGGIVLISLIALAAIYSVFQTQTGSMDHCSTCTETITSNESGNRTLTNGDVLCIANGATYSGNITINGDAKIVNEGTFSGRLSSLWSGSYELDNYGTVSSQTVMTATSVAAQIRNHAGATFSPQNFTLRGPVTEFENHGLLQPHNFTFDNNASLQNHKNATVSTDNLTVNGGTIENQGTFHLTTSNFTLNAGVFTNLGILEVQGNMVLNSNSEWTNTGEAEIGNHLTINSADLHNDSSIVVGKHFTLNGGGYVFLDGGAIYIMDKCTINGDVEGPASGGAYGAMRVHGKSTFNGGGSMTGLVDFCDSGLPTNGFDNLWGTLGPYVTFCENGPFAAGSSFPIELTNFEAQLVDGVVEIRWETATELNNDFFTIERSGADRQFEAVGQVEGAGTSDETLRYSYVDQGAMGGRMYYRLKQTDFDGQFSYSPIVEVQMEVGDQTEMKLYPNPANLETTLSIMSSSSGDINVEILTTQGQVVGTVRASLLAGRTELAIPLGDLSAGIYLIAVKEVSGKPIGTPMRLVKE